MDEVAAIEMEGVEFSYDGAPVVENVSFAIPAGDFAGIVGPNGGGKTTLLKLMLGLLRPDRGTVRVFGRSPGEVATRVGYVAQGFQYDRSLPMSALDVVMMGRLGVGRGRDRDRAVEALGRVGIAELRDRHFADTSAGQQQRILIARALATDPAMLMLDEPTASLDAAAEREIYDLLQQLNRQITVIVVTHDLGFVSRAVKSVLCVNRRVRRHPTAEMSEITGDLLEEMYGSDFRVVRHDQDTGEGACRE